MSLSPLKFSFGISLLVHGLVISGAVLFGIFHQTATVVAVGDVTTLELIAAPAAAPASPVEPVGTTATPPAIPSTPTQPPEELVPPKPAVPLPAEEAIPPTPAPIAPTPERATEPAPILPAAMTSPTTSAITGDNSSPLPGKDFRTVAGSPTAKAKPDYLKNPEPEYPLAARRRGQQGTVLLNITVSPEGRPKAVSLQQSSGFELLDQAAIKAAQTWDFEPARVGTVAVESKIEVPVRFKLTN